MAPVTRKADGEIVGYRVRWYETDPNGIRRHPSKSFSAKKFGNLDRALAAAVEYLDGAHVAVRVDGSVAKPDGSGELTPNDVLTQWIEIHGPDVSEDHGDRVVRNWANNIETRPIGRTRLKRISADPSLVVHFQDELIKAGFTAQKRYEVLKDFRTVMRWGRKRHPAALTVDVNGVIELPKVGKSRLAYAADAVAVERLIEAVLARSARDDLRPLRDAAYIACMGFTIASEGWVPNHTDTRTPPDGGGVSVFPGQKEESRSATGGLFAE